MLCKGFFLICQNRLAKLKKAFTSQHVLIGVVIDRTSLQVSRCGCNASLTVKLKRLISITVTAIKFPFLNIRIVNLLSLQQNPFNRLKTNKFYLVLQPLGIQV